MNIMFNDSKVFNHFLGDGVFNIILKKKKNIYILYIYIKKIKE